MLSKIFYSTLLIGLLQSFYATLLFAQTQGSPEMADVMRQSGKIYVVVVVILIVFIGLVLYLVNLDKKIRQLEQQTKDKH